ncbi:UNVERIFIED_CONTAM: hypothetical protein NCL1_31504 [Trichonephila clavipes]
MQQTEKWKERTVFKHKNYLITNAIIVLKPMKNLDNVYEDVSQVLGLLSPAPSSHDAGTYVTQLKCRHFKTLCPLVINSLPTMRIQLLSLNAPAARASLQMKLSITVTLPII